MRYTLLFDSGVKNFQKDNDPEALESLKTAVELAREISVYADDITLVGRMSGFSVTMAFF